MRAKAGIVIVICLLLLVGTAGAAVGIPDTVVVTTDKLWIIANNGDQSTITVTVTNTTPPYNGNVQGVTVNLAADPLYGTLSAATVTTDSSGMASSTFKVKKKSGTANITATVTTLLPVTLNQNIDHDSPYTARFEYPLEGTVATEVPFNISLTDLWGNRIDNRKAGDVHTITLHVHGPAPDDCLFSSSATHDLSQTLDANGNASVMVTLTSSYGPNSILMDAFGSIPDKLEWITAITRGTPFSIEQVIEPYPYMMPADNDPLHKYTIKYTLRDQFNNPTRDQWIWVNTTIGGEDQQYKSNNLGLVWVTYGPRSTTATINIRATSLENSTVTISETIGFYNTSPTNMEITASPQTLASLDVNPAIYSEVNARVVDMMGNVVAGENVTFSLAAPMYAGTYTITAPPTLASPQTVSTDGNGNAIIRFYPGAFTTDKLDPNYNEQATGNCTVIAVWNSNTKTIPITWKNYPYLSAKTVVTPQRAQLGGMIDISIELKGDGWALQPDPIDVVITTDRSGSMAGTKIIDAKAAAITFAKNLSAQDKVGLVSFGGTSSTDLILTTSKATVESTINGYGASGMTPMRSAIYLSANMIKYNGRTDAVRAVVLLTDGVWNNDGDPLGGAGALSLADGVGTTSVIDYAKNNNMKLYIVGLGVTPAYAATLDGYATTTGGKYYNAPTTAELAGIYAQIVGELQTSAGVNTAMSMDFQNVNVTGVEMPGNLVFIYQSIPYSAPDTGSTLITWQDGVKNVTNQSADWNTNQRLDFTIGTIKIGEEWKAKVRLKANQTGSIDIFNQNSVLSMDGTAGRVAMGLDKGSVIIFENITSSGMSQKTISLVDLKCTEPGEIKALLPVAWSTNYNGIDVVRERVYYSIDNGPYVQFAEITGIPPGVSSQQAQLDVTKLPPGGYQIKVIATAVDTPDAVATLPNAKTVGGRSRSFIKIE